MEEDTWLPGATIGILGGGQLGRMVILEGRKMGYRFVTLDPDEDCPGGQVADRHITGRFDDERAAAELAREADVILYEFENMDPVVVRMLERIKPVPQGSALLEVTRHRLKEKRALFEAGVPVPPFHSVRTRDDLAEAMEKIGVPSVLKTVTGGYDGKGQWRLTRREDAERLPPDLFGGGREFILEQFVPFAKELSVVVARNRRGETVCFPPAVNLHRQGILHLSAVPAPVANETEREAIRLAGQVAEGLGVVGLVAVEMFLLEDGRLLVNELAPRPHNSGHYTYDACATSQFEQFLRAALGLPLGPVNLTSAAVMVNVLGEHAESLWREFSHLPREVKVHWYGKREARPGRKMGHVTILAETREKALAIAERIPVWPPLTEREKRAMYESITHIC
jgi:5-(carboxyamino)imidazole ribonucleotide synthase